jgi:WD40 repeat protein
MMTTAIQYNVSGQPTWQVTPQTGLQINSVAVSPDGQLTVGGTSSEFGTGQFNFYGYDATGVNLWSVPVTADDDAQGIFWVAVSADKRFAACGGETSKTCGFLYIVDAGNGDILFQDNQLPSRVNQLTFSQDGTLLLADFEQELRLYQYAIGTPGSTPAWSESDGITLPTDFSSYSAVLAATGDRVWVGGINYNAQPVYTGLVQQIEVENGQFGAVTLYDQDQGVMRVVTTEDGAYAAAARHDGSCAFFQAVQPTTAFVYKPDLASLDIAYAVAITETPAKQLVIVVGANQGEAGVLYRVDAMQTASQIANYPIWGPQPVWNQSLQYAVNPGVTLDLAATRVSATDGKPDEQNGGNNQEESPGNFYLLDACSGQQLWQYGTRLMNWPMALTPDGATAVGGSDDGSIYYWKLQ